MHPYTALCPSCNAEMDLTQKQISQADGDVICGNCNHRFHAPDHLLKGFYTAQGHGKKPPPKVRAAGGSSKPKRDEPQSDRMNPVNDLLVSNDSSYVNYRRRRRIRQGFGVLVNCVLLTAFVLQLMWVRFDEWAAKESMRPIYSFLCSIQRVSCRLPGFVEPSNLALRDLRVDLRDDAVYVMRASMRNDSRRARPLPWVEVVFSGEDGARIATGRFSPDQYLADADTSEALIAGGEDFNILLEIRKPSGQPTNYAMRLIAVSP